MQCLSSISASAPERELELTAKKNKLSRATRRSSVPLAPSDRSTSRLLPLIAWTQKTETQNRGVIAERRVGGWYLVGGESQPPIGMSKANPVFTRQVPAFLRQYESLLSVNKKNYLGESTADEGEEPVDDFRGKAETDALADYKKKFLEKKDEGSDGNSRPFTFVSTTEAKGEEISDCGDSTNQRVIFHSRVKKRGPEGDCNSLVQAAQNKKVQKKSLSLLSFNDDNGEEKE